MIGAVFSLGSDVIEIRVIDSEVYFRSSEYNGALATIDGLRLSKEGAIKEFPDLEGDPKWKEKAIFRFKEKIASFPTEKEKINYLIDDLKKFGYRPLYLQQAGFRPKKL